jgi:hypothetical protein
VTENQAALHASIVAQHSSEKKPTRHAPRPPSEAIAAHAVRSTSIFKSKFKISQAPAFVAPAAQLPKPLAQRFALGFNTSISDHFSGPVQQPKPVQKKQQASKTRSWAKEPKVQYSQLSSRKIIRPSFANFDLSSVMIS